MLCIRQPDREDIINIVHRMYGKDGISRNEVVSIVDTFPNQGMSASYITVLSTIGVNSKH